MSNPSDRVTRDGIGDSSAQNIKIQRFLPVFPPITLKMYRTFHWSIYTFYIIKRAVYRKYTSDTFIDGITVKLKEGEYTFFFFKHMRDFLNGFPYYTESALTELTSKSITHSRWVCKTHLIYII